MDWVGGFNSAHWDTLVLNLCVRFWLRWCNFGIWYHELGITVAQLVYVVIWYKDGWNGLSWLALRIFEPLLGSPKGRRMPINEKSEIKISIYSKKKHKTIIIWLSNANYLLCVTILWFRSYIYNIFILFFSFFNFQNVFLIFQPDYFYLLAFLITHFSDLRNLSF